VRVELVLLPGMDGTGDLFAPLQAALGTRVSTYVLPYANQGGAGYEILADRLAEFLPTSPFVLLGESFAGPLAILLAARRPPGLRGLVLVATFSRSPRPWTRHLSALLPWVFMTRAWAHASLPFLIGNRASAPLRHAYVEAVSSIDNAALRGRLAATLSVDVDTELASIDVPIMFLRASRDALVPREASEHARGVRADMVHHLVDGPHGILQANPRDSAEHILAFINGINADQDIHQGLRNQ
jgi:pimeloyl-ACP methyl ester carboxylesterase